MSFTTAPDPQPSGPSTGRHGATAEGLQRLTGRRWGYATGPVEELLTPFEPALHEGPEELRQALERVPAEQLPSASQIRTTAFARERGGYAPASVDEALDRLEDAVARLEDRRWAREHGEQAQEDRADELCELVLGRLDRPAGRRFRSPSGTATRGYAAAEVDRLCEHVLDLLGDQRLPQAQPIREAVFAPARGARSYEEQQVDAFLDRLVDLLRALE